jgi:hypothetical protein
MSIADAAMYGNKGQKHRASGMPISEIVRVPVQSRD